MNGDITLAAACQCQCATKVILFNISFVSSLCCFWCVIPPL